MVKVSGTGRSALRGLVLASLLVSVSVQGTSLAPEHEVRRLMLATEEAVDGGNWGEAGEYLNRLQGLEGDKPADYYYFRGRVMQQSDHFNEAQSALEAYVAKAGSEGTHYQDSLKRITAIEKARKERSRKDQNRSAQNEPVAIIEPADSQAVGDLKRLYLVDSDREALTLHLNSLLDLAGWRADQRVVRLDVPADISYRIAAGENLIEIQESEREGEQRITKNTKAIEVYGISPQVEWDCQAAPAATCWIYDPRDGSRLLKLGPDRNRAEDIASTLGRLIKTLQSPG